jgi:hypothetical protein
MLYTQYSNAVNLRNLLNGGLVSKIDGLPYEGLLNYLTINSDEFLNTYFSLAATTSTDGLDNWGRILQVDRTIYLPNVETNSIFGFDTGVPPSPITTGYPQNFNNGNFWGGDEIAYALNDYQYLFLLQLRYAKLTTNCSIASIIAILNIYFRAFDPTQEVIVNELSIMEMTITLTNPAPAYQIYILQQRPDVLPIPAGVKYNVIASFL